MSSSVRFLLLMAAVVSGCLLPESTLVERSTKSAAPSAQRTSDAGNRPDVANRSDTGNPSETEQGDAAASRSAADGKCNDVDEDAGRPTEGACCNAPAQCYDGPKATLATGRCRAGVRACRSGRLGPCEGSVLPRPEACDNAGSDDDCDGQLDNVPSLGTACTPQGAADTCGAGAFACNGANTELVCVAGAAPAELCNHQDDDCDMKVDEAFDLMKDAMNCGACGMRCQGTTPSCCAGSCVDLSTDRRNCGQCGNNCGAVCTCEPNNGQPECRGSLGVCF